jgi:hypothetical protein
MLPLPAVAGTVAVAPANAYVGVTPLCVTVNVCPPIVSVPVRLLALVLAATLYVTVPLPVVDAPAVIVNHAALLVAVHAKSVAFAVTATVLPVAPVTVAVSVAGASVTLPVIPLCVTVNVCPPIVSVPVRLFTLGFAATVYVTVPLPVVDAPAVIVNQAAFDVAVHAKSEALEVTATVLEVAPAAVAESIVDASDTLPVTPL